jgi:hypothetical protein
MYVSFSFDTTVAAEAEMAERCWEFQRQQRLGVNEAGLIHILETRSGQLVVRGAATHFRPDEHFTRADLSRAIGHPEDTVFSWVRQLGRPEKKYGMKVFVHHEDGSYSLTPQMHEAIVRLAD